MNWKEQWNLVKMIPSTVDNCADLIQICCNCLSEMTHSQAKVIGFDLDWTNAQVHTCMMGILERANKDSHNILPQPSSTKLLDVISHIATLFNDERFIKNDVKLFENIFKVFVFLLYAWTGCNEKKSVCFQLIDILKKMFKVIRNVPFYDGCCLVEVVELYIDRAFYCKQIPKTFFSIYNNEVSGRLVYHVAYSLYQEGQLYDHIENLTGLCERFLNNDKENVSLICNVIACSSARNNQLKSAIDLIKKTLSRDKPAFPMLLLANLAMLYTQSSNISIGLKIWKSLYKQNASKLSNYSAQHLFVFLEGGDFCVQEEFDFSSLCNWPAYQYYLAIFALLGNETKDSMAYCEQVLSSSSVSFDETRLPFHNLLPTPNMLEVQVLLAHCRHANGFYKLPISLAINDNKDLQNCSRQFKLACRNLDESQCDLNQYKDYFKAAEQLYLCLSLKLYQLHSLFNEKSYFAMKEMVMFCLMHVKDLTPNAILLCNHDQTDEGCLSCKKHFYDVLLRKGKSKLLFNYAFVSAHDPSSNSALKKNDLIMALHNSMQYDLRNLTLRWNSVLILFKIGMKMEGIKVWCKTRSIASNMSMDELDCAVAIKSEELELVSHEKRDLLSKDIAILREMYP